MKIYLVGGAVRDELLGLPVKERDYVVVGSTPQEMLAQGFTGVGKSFPVFLHPDTKEEYALARTERKIGPGYHGFEFDTGEAVTLEEDLMRRDLTINAIAKDENGDLIDPYGGQADLKKKILRHVSPAFMEDPVRVLRIARFAARFAHLGFTVADETNQLMQQMVQQGELDHLVSERVWKEMEQALKEPSPWVFIQTLRACGALKVILPQVDALYGVPQPVDSHPEKDVGIHIEMVLQQAARLTPDPVVRFAALLHDVGKGLTPKEHLPHHPNHEAAGEQLVRELCKRLRPPVEYQQLALMVTQLHGECYQAKKMSPEQLLQLLERCDLFRRPEKFTQLLLACEADYKGRPGYEDKPYPNREFLEQVCKAALQVNPKTVIAELGTSDGLKIKQAIAAARTKAIADVADRTN